MTVVLVKQYKVQYSSAGTVSLAESLQGDQVDFHSKLNETIAGWRIRNRSTEYALENGCE